MNSKSDILLRIFAPVILFSISLSWRQSQVNSETVQNKYPSDWMEKSLIRDLLMHYDRRARPTVDNKTFEYYVNKTNATIQQITVEFGLSLIQIMKLDEMQQILTSNVRTLYRWRDDHLRWNPTEYDNITHVHVPTHKIWLPDISIYNYADERMEERRQSDAIVKHDGTIEWHPMAIFKSTCPVRIKYFPFDEQCCKLKFGPWTYDGFRVNITFYDNKDTLITTNIKQNAEWTLNKSRAVFNQVVYRCCPEPYPDISFYILIRRNSAFYNYILILPCFLLSSLTLVLFWLPAESPAKMVLGMNIFIAFFLLVVLLEKSIPSASNAFPLIGKYYCVNMTLITLSTFLCLIIVNFHFRGDNRQEAPHWLKQLTIKHGARILMVDLGPMVKNSIPPSTASAGPVVNKIKSFITNQKSATTTTAIAAAASSNPKSHHNTASRPSCHLQHTQPHSALPATTQHHYHHHTNNHPYEPHTAPPPQLPSNNSNFFNTADGCHNNCCQISCQENCCDYGYRQSMNQLSYSRCNSRQQQNNHHHHHDNYHHRNQEPPACCYGDDYLTTDTANQIIQPTDPPSSCQFNASNTVPTATASRYPHSNPHHNMYSHPHHHHPSANSPPSNSSSRDCTPDRITAANHNPGFFRGPYHQPQDATPFLFDTSCRQLSSNSEDDDDFEDDRCMTGLEGDDDDDDDDEIERDLNFRGQLASGGTYSRKASSRAPVSTGNRTDGKKTNSNEGYFKDYEEDLEEFLFECVQSPQPQSTTPNPRESGPEDRNTPITMMNPLQASWASYNSAALNASCSLTQSRLPQHAAAGTTKPDSSSRYTTSQPQSVAGLKSRRSTAHRQSTRGGGGSIPINNGPGLVVTRRVNLITKDINDLIKDLAYIQKNNENRDRVNRIVAEWRAVGMVLDRFFFVLYVVAIILSLILFFPKAGNINFHDKNGKLNCDVQNNDSSG